MEILSPSSREFFLAGELDLGSVADAEAPLLAACESPGDLTLHLEGLAFMDSAGLHLLARVANALKGNLHLAGVPPPLRKLLEISGMDRHPKIVVHGSRRGEEATPR